MESAQYPVSHGFAILMPKIWMTLTESFLEGAKYRYILVGPGVVILTP